MIFGTI